MSATSPKTIVHMRPLVTVRDGLNFGLGFFVALAIGVLVSATTMVVVGMLASRLALLLADLSSH
jgi:hypothetical protein